MYLIDEDVSASQRLLMTERDLNNERAELLNPVEKKPKGQPFDPFNAYKLKTNTFFKSKKVDNPLLYESIPVESKELLFVMIGFYDYQLFRTLFEAKVPCLCLVQVVEPSFKPISSGYDNDDGVNCSQKATKRKTKKSQALLDFWTNLYNNFENENYEECFTHTYHMLICPASFAFETQCVTTKLCVKVFNTISDELLRFFDVQRCYANYIRHLKMCNVGPKPNFASSGKYPLYNKIMNLLPPECFNVSFLLYAMLEQLQRLSSSNLPATNSSEIFVTYESPAKELPTHKSIKRCIGDILKRAAPSFCSNNLNEHRDGSKANLGISRKPFLTHERNHNYIRISPYEKIRPEYLRINHHGLEMCRSALLWKRCNFKELQVFLNKYNLKNLASVLELPVQEIQYALHVVLFHSMKCSTDKNSVTTCNNSFTSLFAPIEDTAPGVTTLTNDTFKSIPGNQNVYEVRNMASFKWYDKLTSDVMLQDLFDAEQNHACMDYKFNAFDDTILLRFHNDLDEFGLNRRVHNESLRTNIGLKDFCKYVINEDCEWLKMQEEKYLKDREKEYDENVRAQQVAKQTFYPELIFTDSDFVQPGSFKAKAKNETKLNPSPTTAPIATLEKLSEPPLPLPSKKLSLHFADSDFRYYAYDHCDHRLQLTGSTILFHSQDGVKVTVDQTRFLKSPKTLSINVSVGGHSLVLHKNEITWSEPLTFHFALANQTIVAFGKPHKPKRPESKLFSNLYHAIKEGDPNLRQRLYFVSETQSRVMKCFDVPMITKRNLILSQDLLTPFLREVAKRKIPVKYVLSSETLSNEEITEIKNVVSAKLRRGEHVPRKRSTKFITITNTEEVEDVQDEETLWSSQARRAFSSEDFTILKRSTKKVLGKIREAQVSQIPIFKICSSRLHKNQYVKRVKSSVAIPEGTVIKRLAIKPRLRYGESELKISKLLPIKPLIVGNSPNYNLKVSLPSGLIVETVPGVEGAHFCLRQRYVDVGPQSKSISSESSRTFLRNGILVISKNDGNLNLLNVNGHIANCNLSTIKEKGANNSRLKRKVFSHLTHLHAYGANFRKFKRHLQRVVYRLEKHEVSKSFTSYSRSPFRRLKNCHSGVYFLQNSMSPCAKFSLITCDGRKITKVKSAIVEEKKFYTSTVTDYRYEEVLFTREDGTHSLLNRDGVLITQFPDGSRISSWIYIEPELIYVVDEPIRCNITCDKQEQASLHSVSGSMSSTDDKTKPAETGWVSVFLNFKLENPHYATVAYYGSSKYADITLPGNININMTDLGEYKMQVDDRIAANITCDKLVLESQLCHNCLGKCTTTLNLRPFFNKERGAFNSSKIKLLKTVDSFRKKFVVNYDGRCYKNTDYEAGGRNKECCEMHRPFEFQQLFLLTRSLNGCKLWDTMSFENQRLMAQKHEHVTVKSSQDKHSSLVILETSVDVPKDYEFMLPYKEKSLTLTKQKANKCEEAKTFYTKRLILRGLPSAPTLLPFYKTLRDLLTPNPKITWSGASEFFIFYDKILTEFKSDQTDKKKAYLLAEAEKMHVAEPVVPLSERLKNWKRRRASKINKIRHTTVPLYYNSKQREDLMKELYPEPTPSESLIATSSISNEAPMVPSEASVSCDHQPESLQDEAKTNSVDTQTQVEHSVSLSVQENLKMGYSIKKDLNGNVHANEILKEVILRFSSFLEDVEDKNENVSVHKVEYVAEKIYNNILFAANEFDSSRCNDYITIAATIIVKNVTSEHLNTAEMRYLVTFLSGPIVENMGTCIGVNTKSCTPCFDGSSCTLKQPADQDDSTSAESNQVESAYEVYCSYSGKTKIGLRPSSSSSIEHSGDKVRPKGSSLTVVYESSGVDHDKSLDPKAKYLIRSSYTNLIQSQGGSEVCTKCIETTSFWTKYAKRTSGEENDQLESVEQLLTGEFSEAGSGKDFPSTSFGNFESNQSIVIEDSESRTVALDRDTDDLPSDSMMALFSLASLKAKNMQNMPPYIERDPNDIQKFLTNAITSAEGEDRKRSKLIQSALSKCRKCVKKGHGRFSKNKSLTDVVNQIRADNPLLSSQTAINGSLLDILQSDVEELDGKKHGKHLICAEITNKDARLVKEGCPPIMDQTTTYRVPRQEPIGKIVKKSVGMVTKEGTTDKRFQTRSFH
ncbi:hypothetical protein PPYR_04932 [Photinus pyralis]|uniref:Uncharacterized protein n=2 Tax=Photinus pyralis TaxID=7054 RepID=A0A5N4AZH7_PHOPY|nr:hypothetical protein PPYR_04931 [Photinus pyralis]KAB0802746.1 hypothetical protein PPYR_04932 [Photinus pyralis]